MNPIERARLIRAKLDTITKDMSDEQAVDNKVLFPEWNGNGVQYTAGDRVLYMDRLYVVLQNHTSQSDWTPSAAVSLFALVLIPDPEVIPDWVQPESTNPYMKGDKVKHLDKIWISDVDNNVWEPSVYGWTEVVLNAD
nr:carbohydrate-binding protein [uncultured Ruminococcus sp.]